MAQRLNSELDRKGWRTADFEERLRRVPTLVGKGSSYPTIKAIRDGKQEPNLVWIGGAAKVLGVTPSWLAFGEGLADDDAAAEARPHRFKLGARVIRAFERGLPYDSLTDSTRAVLWDTWLIYRRVRFKTSDNTQKGLSVAGEKAAKHIAKAIGSPLKNAKGDIPGLELNLFVEAMARALLLLLPVEEVRVAASTPVAVERPTPKRAKR